MQDELGADELERAEITGRLDIALTNMVRGLMLFAPDGELLLVNARCARLLELPDAVIAAGMTMPEMTDMFARCNPAGDRLTDDLHSQLMTIVARQQSASFTFTLLSGRVIGALQETLVNGGWLRTYKDITERRRSETQISYRARHDVLSGLANRSTFNERRELAIGHLGCGIPFAVLWVDLDRFKEVNDTFGHAAGEALLKLVSDRPSACVRETDTVARLGGNEFAIVQYDTNYPFAVMTLARRIVDVLTAPYDLDGRQILIVASVGIALAPADGTLAGILLKNAELALYGANAESAGPVAFSARARTRASRRGDKWRSICARRSRTNSSSLIISR